MIYRHNQFYLIVVFLILTLITFSQDSSIISHFMYHKYEGNYQFENGQFISGGLMDEIEGHLIFIEPIDIQYGGLFRPVDSLTFMSLSSEDNSINYEINDDGSVKGLWWHEKQDSMFAEKVSPYIIKEIEFINGNVNLSGELRLPRTKGPHPIIINVHGSGKQTRHMGPWNTVFLKYGIGILSYDKRGSGKSTGDFSTAGYQDFADDVLAAIKFVKMYPGIDSTKIGLHGSSEGGWVSSIVAAKSDDIAFMIIRAGSGVSGSETYLYEVKNELKGMNLSNSDLNKALQFEKQIQAMAIEGRSLEEINSFINENRHKKWFNKIYDDWKGLSQNRLIKIQKTAPIDPTDYLNKVSNTPVLWFLATDDENVPYEISKTRIQTALEKAENNDFEIIPLQGANHAFLIETDNGGKKYIDGYWDKIISWLQEHQIGKEKQN